MLKAVLKDHGHPLSAKDFGLSTRWSLLFVVLCVNDDLEQRIPADLCNSYTVLEDEALVIKL